MQMKCDLVVLGGGPGGYSAAFRAADLGLDVAIVEARDTLGGVCLNVGCIPSKTYLHQAAVIRELEHSRSVGVNFGAVEIDLTALRAHKDAIVGRLVGGLGTMASARKVRIVRGRGEFTGANSVRVAHGDGADALTIDFAYAIVAVGSEPARLNELPDDSRILDSTSALDLPASSGTMLIVGGGIIGLEMATIYAALGMTIDIVELGDGLMPGADRDLVTTWRKANARYVRDIMLETRLSGVEVDNAGLSVSFEGKAAPDQPKRYDYMLMAIGRIPNGRGIAGDAAGLTVTPHGFVPVDVQMRSNVRNIFAIGDVVGGPMLAHKAVHEGHVAAEVIAGEHSKDAHLSTAAFDARVIPSVAYTVPEVAWAGLTETEAKLNGQAVDVVKFPWVASGRALANGCENGFTKLLFNKDTRVLLGGALIGPSAGDMIGEIAHAIEMGSEAADLALTIHPHPTLGETIGLGAEVAEGTCTDLPAATGTHRAGRAPTRAA
ncbi:dihydrolipoyl dehydrogenase [Sphingomonas sp. MG17]|uniref:Dihydrolipoyl dehydrogenase n=1 Tax=Sphingomonas tagetis TaxID=2949092 RepID=A0A9X2HR04_9SPHN|nr:dihydrolipoyl dehydrogenase [Sphingomonas tagetis]MCP3730290.1 dihydrolipoyl dehydrogenase [Sphingomonas tagetis]